MKDKALATDLYELTMGQTYFDNFEKDEVAVFDVFFRTNPFNGNYTVSGGLDKIIDYIKNLSFNEDDIVYLKKLGLFTDEYLNYLRDFKFTGNLYAVPDGTIIYPNEPIITVKAPIIEAQIIETMLLVLFNYGSLITTKAARLVEAASGRPIMEFGTRRSRGDEAAVEAAKYAVIGGMSGTSNVLAAKKYGLVPMGTMAHSLVQNYEDERKAFLTYAKSNPNNCLFLVDTYDTLRSGIPNAIWVADNYLVPNGLEFKGIRIDSGDLAYLSKEARKMLDEAGYNNAKICLSNGLDEDTIISLDRQGACFDSIGLGDNISAINDRVNGVYKLSAVTKEGVLEPRIKLSNDSIKTTNPGYKKVYRFYDKETGYALADVIALASEIIPDDEYTLVSPVDEWKQKTIKNYNVEELQVPIFVDGELVYEDSTIDEKRERVKQQMKSLYPEIKRLENPQEYIVDLSIPLLKLKRQMIKNHTYRDVKGKALVKIDE